MNASSTAAVNEDVDPTAAAVLAWEARAMGGEGCGCEDEGAEYRTLGVNPMVL